MSQLVDESRGVATSRLRMCGYAALITALCFAQSAGRMVADTKFDLVTAPGRFLAAAVHLWDPQAAFGQLQNQAYGYAWPMGPFFWAGHLLHLPEWVVQRLWWSLLLCLAFFGVVRLAQRLRLGSPITQVVAGFAFVLSPRITTLLGGVSVEIWPMALAAWVLLPLVGASERGSVRRGAATSALVVACCGGVNAVAVAAVLPLGLLWILTRAAGPRKWPLLGWWTLFTTVATFWWVGPLLVLGRYSPPFLDYIENATITTVPTGLARTLVGTSDWVAYFAGIDYPAGQHLVTTPFLVLDAAGIVALGLLGMLLRDNPHQRFLVLGLLTGVTLVGFGYSGDLAGWFAADRTSLLDAALAPFRNLHKFDVVLRLPLVLGLAHALRVVPALLRGAGATAALRMVQVATALALVALALPWLQDEIAPRGGVVEVPPYWTAAAGWLHQHDDDGTVSLELPAAAFGVYDWGNTHDDVMQGLATSPWAVRNVIPLAPPGNVVFLDAVTRVVESGHPSATLAPYLAANGVSHLVVRNDLNRFQTGAPDPVYVRSVLEGSPGLTLARSFGPRLGTPPWGKAPNGRTRVVRSNGMGGHVGSIDVYDVSAPAGARLTARPLVVTGGPEVGLRAGLAGPAAQLLPEDVRGGGAGPVTLPTSGQVLTDTLRRQETNFAAVRWNQSATMPAGAPYRLVGPEHAHRFLQDPERWQTTAAWSGSVSAVGASSSEAYADALPPLRAGAHPGAALDGDPATEWRSARQLDPTGQWWQETFAGVQQVPRVTVRLGPDSVAVPRLAIRSDQGTRVVPAPAPGRARTYALGFGAAGYLRITAAGRDLRLPGSVSIAEVRVPGLTAQRYLQLPVPDGRFPVDAISLQRDPDRAACVVVGWALPCDDALVAPGEDGDTLARRITTTASADYRISGTVSLRRTTSGRGLLRSDVTASAPGRVGDVAEGPLAVVDRDHHTTWVLQHPDQVLTLRFARPRTFRSVEVRLNRMAPVARPTQLEARAAGHRRVVTLDAQGRGSLPGWRAKVLRLRVVGTRRALGTDGEQLSDLPAGITGLVLNDPPLTRSPDRPRAYACGAGPLLRIGDTLLATRLQATSKQLVRGQSVPLQVCGSSRVQLPTGTTDVLASPSRLFRIDSLSLQRVGAGGGSTASSGPLTSIVPVARDGRGDPTSVRVPARSQATVLSLPQNLNAGWTASWRGHALPAQRVDGWRQGWLLPAGPAGTVALQFTPARTFIVLLGVGAGLLLLTAVGLGLAVLRARRRVAASQPRLVAGRPGLLDLVLAVVAGGLLCGWWGLLGVAVAGVVGLAAPRFAGWSLLAPLLALTGTLALSWSWITERSWAVTWSQAWCLAAVCCGVGALAALRRDRPGSDPAT